MEDIELILINISGDDKPGVTSALTEILARHNAQILDIGQSDIHHKLSLGILFRTTADMSGDIMKDLLFKCYELGVGIHFTPITVDDYEAWVAREGKSRWIITILGRTLTAKNIALVSAEIARQELNIASRYPIKWSRVPRAVWSFLSAVIPRTLTPCADDLWKYRRATVSIYRSRRIMCSVAAAA